MALCKNLKKKGSGKEESRVFPHKLKKGGDLMQEVGHRSPQDKKTKSLKGQTPQVCAL